MTPWIVKNGDFSKEELEIFYEIRETVQKLPDIRLGSDLSCHILARAVKEVFGGNLKVVDGYFYPRFNHSWLVFPSGNIIDVYPVQIVGGPIMVRGRYVRLTTCPGDELYLPEELNKSEFHSQKFLEDVDKVALALAFARSELAGQGK